MKRFNLLIPKTIQEVLIKTSKIQEIPKAKIIKRAVEYYKENKNLKSFTFNRDWILSKDINFNFQISDEDDSWIDVNSTHFNCSKGELLRVVLWEYLINQKSEVSTSKKIIDKEDIIVKNIKILLNQKSYHKLHAYLNSFTTKKIMNLGQPEFIINVLNETNKNTSYLSYNLKLLKAKMLWVCGNTVESVYDLNTLASNKEDALVNLKAKIILADIYDDTGQYKKASEIIGSNWQEIEKMPNNYYKMKAYNKFGLSFFYLDNLEKVKIYYEKSLSLAKTAEEKSIAHRYLASISHSMEDNLNAEEHFKISNENFKQDTNLDEYVRMLINYSEFHITSANWIKAEDLINKAIEIANKIGHVSNYAWALRVKATIMFNTDKNSEALTWIDKSIEIALKTNSENVLIRSYLTKAKILIFLKRYHEARNYLEKCKFLEKKNHSGLYSYTATTKWDNYIKFKEGENINFVEMQKQSSTLKQKNHKVDEVINDFVLGYLYLNSQDNSEKSKGKNLLRSVQIQCMQNENKQLQFATEAALKYDQFIIV